MEGAVTSSKTMAEHSQSPVPTRELPASKLPTPLGVLGTLPRELRDEIYRHFCHQDYHFDGESVLPCRKWTATEDSSTWNSIRNIVTVSTAIRRELLTILYANAVFNFDVPIGKVSKTRTRNDIPFVDYIKNVRWIIYLWVMSDTSCIKYNIPYDHLNQRISEFTSGISLFTGPDISRKS